MNGSLSLPSGAAITVEVSSGTTSAPLSVEGTATLGGTLTIVFVDEPTDSLQVPIIDTAGSTGSFAAVDVQLLSNCKQATATVQQDAGGTLVALLSVDNGGCKSRKLSGGAIAGIAVGIVALLVIVAIIVLALVRHRAPACCAFRFNDETAQFVS